MSRLSDEQIAVIERLVAEGHSPLMLSSREVAALLAEVRASRAASPETPRAATWTCPKCRETFFAMSADHPRECKPGDCAKDRALAPGDEGRCWRCDGSGGLRPLGEPPSPYVCTECAGTGRASRGHKEG